MDEYICCALHFNIHTGDMQIKEKNEYMDEPIYRLVIDMSITV